MKLPKPKPLPELHDLTKQTPMERAIMIVGVIIMTLVVVAVQVFATVEGCLLVCN